MQISIRAVGIFVVFGISRHFRIFYMARFRTIVKVAYIFSIT